MGLKVSSKTKTDKTKDMVKRACSINNKSVEVGVLEGEHKWLAGIHEYGCNITAKRAKYLTIPCHPDAVGKSASSFSDLVLITSKKGNKLLAKVSGDNITPYYLLTKSVKIPERSFLRSGHDKYIDEVIKKAEQALPQVISGEMSESQYLDMIGQMLATKIKTYARDLASPANSKLTTEAKGSSNPLIDTGDMIEGITWRIE